VHKFLFAALTTAALAATFMIPARATAGTGHPYNVYVRANPNQPWVNVHWSDTLEDAQREADYMRRQGYEVYIGGPVSQPQPPNPQPTSHGIWVTYEVQLGFTSPATGQTWNEGFTYTRWYDTFGNVVNDNQANAIKAHIADMQSQGWNWTYNSGANGEPVIAQGSW
jgi:hypothetical protein